MNKILIIVYDFPPRVGGGGVLRTVKLAKYLKCNGYEPIILTVRGNKQATSDDSLLNEDLKNIKIYYCNDWVLNLIPNKYYKKNDEIINSVNTKSNKKHIKGILKKLFNYFLLDRGIGFLHYGFKTACDIIKNENISIVYTTSPPHTTHIIGYKLKKKYNVLHVMDFRDSWYTNPLHDTNFIKKLFNKIEENKICKKSDYIITTSKAVKQYFIKDYNLQNVDVVLNGYDDDDFSIASNINCILVNEENKFVISYIGSLGKERTLIYFLKALEGSKEIKNNIIINIVGNIDSQELSIINEYKKEITINLIGNVSHKEAIEWMLKSDSLLVLLPLSQDGMKAIPGKVFEYIRCQKPIIGLCEENSELSTLINENKIGFVANYTDTDSIEKIIIKLYYSNEKAKLHINDYTTFSRESQYKKLITIISNLKKNKY